MISSISRRRFLAALPAAAPFGETQPVTVAAVEIWELHGKRETVRGIDQQYRVNPLDIL